MITILVVDDDPHMRNACSRVLSKEGWTVHCVESGDEGLEKMKSGTERIDVVLLDHLMPGMSGLDVLANMRALNLNTPVIFITGFVSDETRTELLGMGAAGCLPKPFTPAQLREAIRKAHRDPTEYTDCTD